MSDMTMVEVVARAIHRTEYTSQKDADFGWGMDHDLRIKQARAALRALLDLTAAMVKIGREIDELGSAEDMWRMIDEALV